MNAEARIAESSLRVQRNWGVEGGFQEMLVAPNGTVFCRANGKRMDREK